MSDIVERLQEESMFAKENPYDRCDHEAILKEASAEIDCLRRQNDVIMMELPESVVEGAIAEIERLRATIAQLRQVVGAVALESPSYGDIRKEIKVTLSTEVDSGLAKELK